MLMDARQRIGNRQAWELLWELACRSLAEAYVEGGCELHVHLHTCFIDGRIADDWGAVVNRKLEWLNLLRSHNSRNEEGKRCEHRVDDMRQPVLVDVAKLVELTEEVVRGEPPRLVVRLQPLDFCFSGWVVPDGSMPLSRSSISSRFSSVQVLKMGN